MTVISVPLGLRFATLTLFLSIPFIAIEVVIVTQAPWWNLPYRSMGYWSLAYALICIPISIWLWSAKRSAYSIVVVLSVVWIVVSAWTAIKTRYPALGFFVIFLLGFFCLVLPWIRNEMNRSFFNPQLMWYQSLPKPIPGLKCQLANGEKVLDLRVSRIDIDGAFIFSSDDQRRISTFLASVNSGKTLEMLFRFRDCQVSCNGNPILLVGKGVGVGVQFIELSADLRKEVGDFVEMLRGGGYI